MTAPALVSGDWFIDHYGDDVWTIATAIWARPDELQRLALSDLLGLSIEKYADLLQCPNADVRLWAVSNPPILAS